MNAPVSRVVGRTDLHVLGWPARSNARHNPYQALLYDAVERVSDVKVEEFDLRRVLSAPRPAILHIHWPDGFLAASKGWRIWPRLLLLRMLAAVCRLRGIKIVWTAHNVKRDGQRHTAILDRWFWPWFPTVIDGVIYMTRVSIAKAENALPGLSELPHALIAHGRYSVPQKTVSGPGPTPTLIFFGALSYYKKGYKVLDAFLDLPAGTACLRICGKMSLTEPDTRMAKRLLALPEEHRRDVIYESHFMPEADLIARIQSADLAVFPYSETLNSGAAILALSAGCPILASDNDLFRELRDLVGPDWVRLIDGELSGAQLAAELNDARALLARGATPDMSAFAWDRIGRETVDFYYKIAYG
jgi:beta-1,4-mannosyltransferase